MEIGRQRGMMANEHIALGSNSYEKRENFICSSRFLIEKIRIILMSK